MSSTTTGVSSALRTTHACASQISLRCGCGTPRVNRTAASRCAHPRLGDCASTGQGSFLRPPVALAPAL
eukprot:9928267-Lingulodinium_polyedra.AAC.1